MKDKKPLDPKELEKLLHGAIQRRPKVYSVEFSKAETFFLTFEFTTEVETLSTHDAERLARSQVLLSDDWKLERVHVRRIRR